ncbi:hypothetical protein J2X82_005101 [Priestia megaterium]|nr:hypothetical protein [Priestia megaterium]
MKQLKVTGYLEGILKYHILSIHYGVTLTKVCHT